MKQPKFGIEIGDINLSYAPPGENAIRLSLELGAEMTWKTFLLYDRKSGASRSMTPQELEIFLKSAFKESAAPDASDLAS